MNKRKHTTSCESLNRQKHVSHNSNQIQDAIKTPLTSMTNFAQSNENLECNQTSDCQFWKKHFLRMWFQNRRKSI